ncbi:hypothetical protein FWK35_00039321 [Aphis craccivora]|uniref:Uncharacterized protein n=1 Tax=Aphis craccivora TaxID=307492 RepID=A0A6G0XEQ1_APHCR|nr:hypothetical protein FWK35_00039321 [Aphis craccivora]
MNQSLDMDYCNLRNLYLVPEIDLRWFDGDYFLPLKNSLCKHFVLFLILGLKEKMLFLYTEIFEILVMNNVITKSFPLFNSIWPYISGQTQWGQNYLMNMTLLLFLYVLYRMIFYTRDLLTALITWIFMFCNNNNMDLESYPIEDFESIDSNDDEDNNGIIDEEEGEYEGDGEDTDVDSEYTDGDGEDTEGDGEDTEGDGEDTDGDGEDTEGDGEDNVGNGEDNIGNGEFVRRGHFRDFLHNDRMNPSYYYHSYPAYAYYPVYIPSYTFYTTDIRSYNSDEFYSANEYHEVDEDSDEETESDFSDQSLDGTNQYYQYEDYRHGDVFGNHIGNI